MHSRHLSSPPEPHVRWARVISNLVSPPVVWAILAFPIAWQHAPSRGQAVVWALTYGLLVCLVPMLYVGWMVRRGHITDLHMKYRQERLLPFVVSMVCTGAAWLLLRWMGAPPLVPLLAAVTLAQLVMMTLITLVWQISMHAMSIASAVTATALLFGALPALAVAPLVPLVGAARLKLRRHTLAQVVAGTVMGALVTVALVAVAL